MKRANMRTTFERIQSAKFALVPNPALIGPLMESTSVIVLAGSLDLQLRVDANTDFESGFIGVCQDTGEILKIVAPWNCEITPLYV